MTKKRELIKQLYKDTVLIKRRAEMGYITDSISRIAKDLFYNNCFLPVYPLFNMDITINKERNYAYKVKTSTWATPEIVGISLIDSKQKVTPNFKRVQFSFVSNPTDKNAIIKKIVKVLVTAPSGQKEKTERIDIVVKKPEMYTSNHSIPLDFPKFTTTCTKCGQNYPYAEAKSGFKCWACRNNW